MCACIDVDISTHARALKRLREKCQEAKHALATSTSTFIEVRCPLGLSLLMRRDNDHGTDDDAVAGGLGRRRGR